MKTHPNIFRCFTIMFLLVAYPPISAQDSGDQYYSFDAPFMNNKTGLFSGALVKETSIFADSTQAYTIEDVTRLEQDLHWVSADQIKPKRFVNYWLRTKMISTQAFKGRHVFHIGESLGNDYHAYDYINTFAFKGDSLQLQHQVGRLVELDKRPIKFWANLIPLDLSIGDTLDVFISLQGFNKTHSPESIALWHVNMKDAFSTQIFLATKSALFYGTLGIQILFFLFLFLIDRERIYAYFSIFGLGLFLTRAFSEFNYESFVPIPFLTNYDEIIYHYSVYITVLGGIFFVSRYLEIPRKGRFMQYVVPVYLAITFISYSRFIFRFSFNEAGTYPTILTPAFYTFLALVLGIYMIMTSPLSDKKAKLLLLLSIIPIIIASILTILFNEGLLPEYINSLHVDDSMKVAILLLVLTLALTVGFRSKSLKEEKNQAIQENLKAKQIIFEKQIRAEQLEEMNVLKTKLYTNITHEFRTPLTVIMGINGELCEMTKKMNLPLFKKEKMLENMQLIQRNSTNLLTLVNQLLNLSKSDSQDLELKLKQDNILQYLNYLTESFYSKADEKNIRLVFYSELPTLIMDYDEQKIQHIIYNLLSNAIKFTPQNGKIVMHASLNGAEHNSTLQLIVKDDGIGIPPDSLPYIFDRFYQVDDSHTRSVDGSGIGLSITKDMVELMGGSISVDSEINAGTTFTISIPITNEAEETGSTQKIFQSKVEVKKEDNYINTVNEELLDSENKPILLIVEDNKDVFSYLNLILDQSYKVIKAVNGEEGIHIAKETIPDLIISDVMMPIKDGFELTNALKQDKSTSHIPIILLTAKATQSDKVEGLSIGADAYLTKPFDKQELLIRINKLIESRLAMQNHYSLTNNSEDITSLTSINSATVANEEPFIKQIQNIIKTEIQNETLNAETLSNEIGISQSQLYRKVKALTGLTINNYIRNFRLHKSIDLLKNTDKDIAEIAYEVGFKSPSYFSRSFHKVYQQSPIMFRKSKYNVEN